MTAFVDAMAPRIDDQATSLEDHLRGMHQLEGIARGGPAKSQSTAAETYAQAASVGELSAASRRLAETAAALRELADRFRVAGATERLPAAAPR